MKNLTKLMITLVVLVAVGTACSKYPGFKKEKQGFYYKFHVINKDEPQPQIGDIVEMTFSMYTKDSVLAQNAPLSDMIIESLYPGDIFAAIQTMHLGDSATFIMNGEDHFQYFWGQIFPFEEKELYFDLKMNAIIPKEEYESIQAQREMEYMTMIEEFRLAEDSLINDYLTKNKVKVKPTQEGLYFMKSISGKGKAVTDGSRVLVHYTGKFLDGMVFDSSLEREPFSLTVGEGHVIPGWEKALLMMKEGDKATVLIPSNLAYGARGADYVIPPYAPLIFDIEVLEVE